MKDYESYMIKYWDKYPDEMCNDFSLDEINNLIAKGLKYHLTDYMFVIYKENNNSVDIIFYCIDGGEHQRKTVRRVFLEHKKFVKMFTKPVFIDELKVFYQRDGISSYDENRNQWRLL